MNRRKSLRSSSVRGPRRRVSMHRRAWKRLDRLLEAVAADESHRVVGAAVGVGAQAVDRHDSRVLEPAGDLGLEQKPARRLAGSSAWRSRICFKRHLAVQLAVERDEDRPQAPLGMGAQDAEPLTVGTRGTDRVGGRAVGIMVPFLGRGGGDASEAGVDLRVAEPGQLLAGRAACCSRPRGSARRRRRTVSGAERRVLPARRWSESRSPRSTRTSAIDRSPAWFQALNAVNKAPCSIKPV